MAPYQCAIWLMCRAVVDDDRIARARDAAQARLHRPTIAEACTVSAMTLYLQRDVRKATKP